MIKGLPSVNKNWVLRKVAEKLNKYHQNFAVVRANCEVKKINLELLVQDILRKHNERFKRPSEVPDNPINH